MFVKKIASLFRNATFVRNGRRKILFPVRLFEKFSELFERQRRDVGLRVGCRGDLLGRLAREYQYAQCAGVAGHRYVSIDAVAHHGDLIGAQAETLLDAGEHVGIGFAQHDVGRTSRGVFEALADRAAVDQHDGLIGRTYAVGVRGDVGDALRCPPCGAAQARVGERHVEGGDHHVGDIVGAVGRRFEAGGLELRDHARRTQQEESFGRRVVRADVVDRGQRRGIHLLARGFDAQRFELVEVVGDALRRIVRQERVADAHLRQVGEEPLGPGEEGHAHVDGAVHIERHVPDAAGAFEKLLVRKGRAVGVDCSHECNFSAVA